MPLHQPVRPSSPASQGAIKLNPDALANEWARLALIKGTAFGEAVVLGIRDLVGKV
jgi:hypothetical protein